jgi:hypothetical protein
MTTPAMRSGRLRRGKTASLVVTAAALVLAVLPAHAAGAATTSTVVLHGLTHSELAPDICGRDAFFSFTIRTQVTHLTEHEDGSFSFNFTETGTYHVDFVDPTVADQDSQFTEAVHASLTPGGTFVVSVAFHDFPTGIRIWERFHLTEVDGSPVVEREIQKVTGCP